MDKNTIKVTCACLIVFYFLLSFISSFQVPVGWDSSIIIDGSYRISLGQAPHTDFFTNIGFLVYLLGALGLFLDINWSYASIYFGFYIFYLFTIFFTTYRFLNIKNINSMLIVIVTFISAYAFTHRIEGYSALSLGNTGLYNHIGHFLLTILCLNTFRILSENKQYIDKKDLYFISIILTCLFIGKITFFLVSIPIITFLIIRNLKAYIEIMLLTFVFVTLIYILMGIKLFDVISYYNLIASNGDSLINEMFSIKIIKIHLLGTPLQYYLAVIILSYGYIRLNLVSIIQGVALCIAVIFLTYFLSVTNGQEPEPFLPFLYSLIFLMYFGFMLSRKEYHPEFKINYKNLTLPLIVSIYLLSGHIFLNTKGHLHWISYNTFSAVIDIKSYINKIKPAPSYHIDCIEPYITSNSQVLSVGSNNIYNYYFNLIPPKETLHYWHESVTFNEKIAKSSDIFLPEKMLSNVNLIFLSKTNMLSSVNIFKKIYKNYLEKNFIEFNSPKNQCIILKRIE